jgi:hypothetical protein
LAQSADSRLDIWQDSQINDRGDHMSTSLPLAGELADDLLYGADAIGAYPFGREDAQRGPPGTTWSRSRSANRIPIFRLGAVICPTLMLLRWIAEREGRAA